MNELKWEIIVWACTIAFYAGIMWSIQKQTQKQLNGVGGLARKIRDEQQDDFQAISLALMILAPEDKKSELAQILLPKK